jgi:hypothetical protein
MKTITNRLWPILALATIATALACGNVGRGDDDDGSSDSDADTDTWDDWTGDVGNLVGTVLAPSGLFPVAGALVYLSVTVPPPFPTSVFCEACEDMTAKWWTLTGPDGTFQLSNIPAVSGTFHLVVQKGLFRRITLIDVQGGMNDIPLSQTTLPGDNSGDGLATIPRFAVLLNSYDLAEDMLAKLGMADLGGDGHFVQGSEHFDCFDDGNTMGYPASSQVFAGQDTLNGYHMVFFPCICNTLGTSFVQSHADMLRNWVSAGGKLYASCWASQWAEFPFPEYIEFSGDDTSYVVGSVGLYDTNGRIEDPTMRAWLEVVAPTENLDAFPFHGAWVKMDNTNVVQDGHGLPENGGAVTPVTWATDVQQYPNSPLTVTYDWDCGRVFFSSYQVVESGASTAIRPQEFVLLYLMMEVGVCTGSYPIE